MLTVVENRRRPRGMTTRLHSVTDLKIVIINNEFVASHPLRKGKTESEGQSFRRSKFSMMFLVQQSSTIVSFTTMFFI